MSTKVLRSDFCVIACAEAWRDAGEIIASPMGTIPSIAARLAKATFSPDLLLSDGVATFLANADELPVGAPTAESPSPVAEGWIPYRLVFDLLWNGRRHVMMGASQIDRFGNQNIACIGDWEKPKAMLLGMRGAPGNTLNHPTSYWVPNQSTRSFVESVDVVSGVGYDRAAGLGAAGRFHSIGRVVSNLGVFDFDTPDHSMRLVSVHPGVTVDEIREATGFELSVDDDVTVTRRPTDQELRLLRTVLDPRGLAAREVPDE